MGDGSAAVPKLCTHTCPICGDRQQKLLGDGDPRRRTINELTNHIRMTGDDRHGATDAWPEEGVPADLLRYVEITEPLE